MVENARATGRPVDASLRTRAVRRAVPALVGLLALGAAGCRPSNGSWLSGATTGPVTAASVRAGSLLVRDVIIEAPRAGQSYPDGGTARMDVMLVNDGPDADQLVKVATPIAAETRLFTDITTEDPSYRPQAVPFVAAFPATSDEPRETPLYVELRDLSTPAREGQSYPVTLTFARAGTLQLAVPVEIPDEVANPKPVEIPK